jgi:HEAT repeat protein
MEWKEKKAIPVYREIMLDSKKPADFRDFCIRPLLDLETENLFDDLVKVYHDKNNHPELRAAALATIGELEDNRTIPLLEKTLADTYEDASLRRAAASGLGESRKARVIPLLLEQYHSTNDLDLKKAIIFAFGSLDIAQAIEPLKRIKETEQDVGLQELINNALRDLKYLEKKEGQIKR